MGDVFQHLNDSRNAALQGAPPPPPAAAPPPAPEPMFRMVPVDPEDEMARASQEAQAQINAVNGPPPAYKVLVKAPILVNPPPDATQGAPGAIPADQVTGGGYGPGATSASVAHSVPMGAYPSTSGIEAAGQKQVGAAEQYKTDIQEAYGKKTAAANRLLGAEKEASLHARSQARIEAAAITQFDTDIKTLGAAQARAEERRQAWVREKYGAITQSTEDYDKAAGSYNPGRFYLKADGSTDYSKRILSAIFIAMGELGASMTGRQNTALKIIDDAISKDLDAQKIMIQAKGEKVRMADSAYGRALQLTGSEAAAEAADRAWKLQGAQRYLDTIRANYKGQAEASRFAVFEAQIQNGLADSQSQLAAALHGASQTGAGAEMATAQAVFSGNMQRAAAQDSRAIMMAKAAGTYRGEHPYLQPLPGYNPDDDERKAAEAVAAPWAGAISAIRDAIEYRRKNGAQWYTSRSGTILANQAIMSVAELRKIRSLRFDEVARRMGIPEDIGAWKPSTLQKFQTLANSLEKQLDTKLKTYGYGRRNGFTVGKAD